MKVTRILVASLLCVVVGGAAYAQTAPGLCLSWNSCPVQVPDQLFVGPQVYKLLVIGKGLAGSYNGHRSRIHIDPGPGNMIPDAWDFDDAGCQASLVAYGFNKFSTCPAFQGAAALSITKFITDPGKLGAICDVSNAFNSFPSDGSKTYAMATISFDHSGSYAGGVNPDPSLYTCGHAEVGSFFDVFAELLLSDGSSQQAGLAPNCQRATWQGGPIPPVAAQPSTWGRVKGLYR